MKNIRSIKIGLKGKLILTMSTLFIISSLMLFLISQNAQKRLMSEVEDNIEDLTKAIQVSVEKLTSSEEKKPEKLKELIMNFKKKGINEISILSESREIIASTNPKKIGTITKKLKESDFLIKAELGTKSVKETLKEINVPIIIGDENYGYINIIMHLENLANITRKNFYIRIFSTLLIFISGTIIIIFLADRYTKPIQKIVDATKRISSGNLTPIQIESSLGPEIKELVTNFNDMIMKLKERQELEKRIKEMERIYQIGQLSSAIAHEIKNPLNFINLAIDQIKDELMENKFDNNTLELLSSIQAEIERINNMVVNFLEFGKPLKLEIVYINLKEMLEDIHNLIKTKIEGLNIEVEYNIEQDIHFIGDKEKLSGCFINLFLNAIESIKSNGKITVNAKIENNKLKISFADTGQGVPISMQERIFEPYFSSKDAGLGLGLAFTKKIIVEHGGDIWLNKDYKKGAEFIIILPLNL